jgi:hypothetical protein
VLDVRSGRIVSPAVLVVSDGRIQALVPEARVLRGELLPVAEQVCGMSVSDAKRLKELRRRTRG